MSRAALNSTDNATATTNYGQLEEMFLAMYIKNRTNASWKLAAPQEMDIAEKAVTFLNTKYMPIFIVLGILGNILSFTVFFFTHLKVRPSSYYLGCLAISDSGYLVVLICVWMDGQGAQLLDKNGMCQGISYLSSVFSCWSTWLTVCFTAERFLTVSFPLRRLQMSNTERAKVISSTAGIVSASINFYILVFTGVRREGHLYICDVYPKFWRALLYINIADTLLTLIIPVILIISMNFMIARSLVRFYSSHKTPTHPSGSNAPSISSRQELTFASPSTGERPCNPVATTQINISRTLLLVSTVFLILNLPSYASRLYSLLVHEIYMTPVNQQTRLIHSYFMLLYYTNFGINFLLYNFGSSLFRKALGDFLTKKFQTIVALVSPKSSDASSSYG